MFAANFLADLVNLTLVGNFGLILGAFLGQIARDLKEESLGSGKSGPPFSPARERGLGRIDPHLGAPKGPQFLFPLFHQHRLLSKP